MGEDTRRKKMMKKQSFKNEFYINFPFENELYIKLDKIYVELNLVKNNIKKQIYSLNFNIRCYFKNKTKNKNKISNEYILK